MFFPEKKKRIYAKARPLVVAGAVARAVAKCWRMGHSPGNFIIIAIIIIIIIIVVMMMMMVMIEMAPQ